MPFAAIWTICRASVKHQRMTIQNPNSFRSDKQFYFALRIKALPSTRRFYRGPAGEALGVGVGDIY